MAKNMNLSRLAQYNRAKSIIANQITLSDSQKKELYANLEQAKKFADAQEKSEIADEHGVVSHSTSDLKTIKFKNRHIHKDLIHSANKMGYKIADVKEYKISENLNIGVMCKSNKDEGIIPIIATKSAPKSMLLKMADSTAIDVGGVNDLVYGEQSPGIQDFETFYMDPMIIEQKFVPGVSEEIIGATKVYPNISLTTVMFNVMQYTSSFRPYNALTRDGLSNFTRSIMKSYFFKFMGNIWMEELDQAAWSQAKINAFASRQKARSTGWKQFLNSLLRFGWRDALGRLIITGIDNYTGKLPNLVATPNQAGSPYSDPKDRNYLQFLSDIAVMLAEVQTRTNMLKLGKNRDELLYEGRAKLVVYPKAIVYWAFAFNPTTATESVLDKILSIFPNVEIILDPLLNATSVEAGSEVKAIWTPIGSPQGYRMQLILENEEYFGFPTLLATSNTAVKSFRPLQIGESGWNYKDLYGVGNVMGFMPALDIGFEYLVDQTAVALQYINKNSGIEDEAAIVAILNGSVDKEEKSETITTDPINDNLDPLNDSE